MLMYVEGTLSEGFSLVPLLLNNCFDFEKVNSLLQVVNGQREWTRK